MNKEEKNLDIEPISDAHDESNGNSAGRKRSVSAAIADRMFLMYLNDHSLRDIAERFGSSTKAVFTAKEIYNWEERREEINFLRREKLDEMASHGWAIENHHTRMELLNYLFLHQIRLAEKQWLYQGSHLEDAAPVPKIADIEKILTLFYEEERYQDEQNKVSAKLIEYLKKPLEEQEKIMKAAGITWNDREAEKVKEFRKMLQRSIDAEKQAKHLPS